MNAHQAFRRRRKRIRFSWISAKIAIFAVIGSALGSAAVYVLQPGSMAAPAMVGLAAGGVAYLAAYRVLVRRMDLASTTLRQVRKHRFENLEAANTSRGDELNALIWQVYRAGLAMEKEFQNLRQIEDYRREFLADVSHELKTPIFTIQGFAETLLNGAIDDEKVNRTFLKKILSNTRRLTNLASDLVEISRIESGELEMRMAPFRLEALVDDVFEHLERVATEKCVALQKDIASDVPAILGDRARISQVFVNLVDNAIKYTNADGCVRVTCRRRPSGEVVVSVSDNGIGIEPHHISRLTERFYRVDKSRSRAQGGTGLGLAIVKHILGAHGTTMTIESRPGKGSTFSFTLQPARTASDPL